MHVVLPMYSTFYDPRTDTQFTPALRRELGLRVAHAEVSDEVAEEYEAYPAFVVMTDEELTRYLMGEPAPEASSGDPLVHGAATLGRQEGESGSQEGEEGDPAAGAPPAPPKPKKGNG